MALTGIQIFKFLPGGKKESSANCKKCGCPTCMAYAMKLAKGQVDISLCPYIDEELKNTILQENRKPQIKVEIGKNNKYTIGDENVMFRHDKTFVNPCCFAIELHSSDNDFEQKFKEINNFKIDRVGEEYKVNAINFIIDDSDYDNKLQTLINSEIPLIITISDINIFNRIKNKISDINPLIYLKSQNLDDLMLIGKEFSIVVDGESIEKITEKTEKLLSSNIKNIVINLIFKISSKIIEPLTMIRRSAIEQKFEPLGFPVMVSYNLTNNIAKDTINLSSLVCKYANLIVINGFNQALLTALITLRMNIYTDPQKPLQVEPKLYEIGDVTPNSKVIITTNFALTYFAVANELENLSEGIYLLITNSDGMSVLTAWSASKFTGEIIAKAVIESKIAEKVNHKNIIIPGLAADLKEEIEEELPEYNIIIGTNDATDLPAFLKTI